VELSLSTPRGIYLVSTVGPPERTPSGLTITLRLERADGIEQLALKCAVAMELLGPGAEAATADSIARRLMPWLEREFEATREAALKSVRSERRIFEIDFNRDHPGPL